MASNLGMRRRIEYLLANNINKKICKCIESKNLLMENQPVYGDERAIREN